MKQGFISSKIPRKSPFMEDFVPHPPFRRRKSHLKSTTIQSFLRILSFCSSDSITATPALPDVAKPSSVPNSSAVSVDPSSSQSQKIEFIDRGCPEVDNSLDAQESNADGNSKSIEDENGISQKNDSAKEAVDRDKVGSSRVLIEEDHILEENCRLTDTRNGISCDRESGEIVQVEESDEFSLPNDAEFKKWSEEEDTVAGQSLHHCVVEQDSNLGSVLESGHVHEQLRSEEARQEAREAVNDESKSVNSIQFAAQNEAFHSEQLVGDELGRPHDNQGGQGLETAVSSHPITSSVCTIGHQEMEEGEIPDDFGFLDQPRDSLLEEHCTVFDNRVAEEVRVSDVFNAQCGLAQTTMGQSAVDRQNMASNSNLTRGFNFTDAKIDSRKVTGKGDKANASESSKTKEARLSFSFSNMQTLEKMVEGNETAVVCSKEGSLASLGLIREVTDYLGTESTEKDTKACKKKKRGPLSEERKAKKKASKKRKRAQVNREQGVKRLKLKPFTKPKVVHDCKFYLKGRCQQGEKCKFSHSGVPLTKSQPCSYFALGTCLKGEDCPFDHQLSNYPCINYNLKGMCRRGETCLFSHKIPPSEGFSLASKFGSAEPMLPPDKTKTQGAVKTDDLNSKFANHLFKDLTQSRPVTSENFLKNSQKDPGAETQPKLPAKAPEGIRFLSIGKAPLDDTSKQLQNKNSPSECNNKTTDGHKQTTEEKPCNTNEMLCRTHESASSSKTPEGIRFFPLGKASLDDTNKQLQNKNSPSGVKNSNEIINRHMQNTVEKPCDSNEMTCRMEESAISSCPSSKSLVDGGQNPRSLSLKAPYSMLTLAQKHGSGLTSHCFQSSSSSSTKNVSGSSSLSDRLAPPPPRSSESGLTDASRILEEFLFSGLNQ